MHLLIVADDLTGAADCAARSRGAGLPAVIHIGSPRPALAPGVAAFTTDSRHLAPGVAGRAVAQALADLPAPSHAIWYKKIDSTLRGNLGAELEAWLAMRGTACALICPAFPAQGRALVDGRLIVHGARQPAELPAMLAAQTQLGVMQVKLADVRAGGARLAGRLAALGAAGGRLLVVDGETDADLAALLSAAERALPGALLCGSAGLASVVAQRLAIRIPVLVTPPELVTPATGPVLAIIGSATALSWRQISAVRAAGIARIVEVGAADQRVGAAGRGSCLLHLPLPGPRVAVEGPAARGWAARLADEAVRWIAALRPARLILSGGDTAQAVLARLGVARLAVLGELEPGMPLCTAVGGAAPVPEIVLKAGGHGDAETLVRLSIGKTGA